MQTVDFLNRVWPSQGVYFLLKATPDRKRHYAFDSPAEAAAAALAWDREGATVYHALASYRERFLEVPDAARPGALRKVYRVRENVSHLRALWLDLDVGSTKPYGTQQAAVTALTAFVRASQLPAPTLLVSSGRGVHVYWTFTQNIVLAHWEPCAQMLKRLCVAHGFLSGPERTADPCSVLRPVGTTHRKGDPRPVALLGSRPDLDYAVFAQALAASAATKGVAATPTPVRIAHPLNDDLIVKREFPPASAHQVAKSCQQIASIAATRGNVEEPLWYAGIGVLRFTTESPDIIHDWSNGHPGYSEGETAAKIAQHARSGTGPTTCDRFRDLNPAGCAGCPHKIKSPLQLGAVIEAAPPPAADPFGGDITDTATATALGETLPNPPFPYLRTKDGKLARQLKAEDGGQVEVWCDYDIYPVRRLRDVAAGAGVVLLRCNTRSDGVVDLPLPTATLADLKALTVWFNKNDIYIGGKTTAIMQAYLQDYLKDLQTRAARIHLHNQLGWKDDHSAFVLGHSVHKADGTSIDNTGAVSTINGFQTRGDLDTWKRVMELYGRPGMEPYQFAVAAAFGAPLMPFTGYEGAVIAMVSPEGGQGKTTALHAINSVWGNPQDTGLQANDTPMAVLKRVGAYGNMPVTLDELSNATGQQLSDLAYQITQGRERRRLRSDATEQATLARWSTILTVTANQSILGRLSTYKTNADAEVHRIIEYVVRNPMVVTKAEAEASFPLLFENYGWAGDAYARWMVANVPVLKEAIKHTRVKLDKAAAITTKERYWSAVIAAVLTGAMAAKKLGLVGWDLGPLWAWSVGVIGGMRRKGMDISRSTGDILAAYLNEFMGGRIVVTRSPSNTWTVLVDLKGNQLVYRVEQDTGRIYIDRSHFRGWFTKNGGDYNSLMADLRGAGLLLRGDTKRSLGQGTNYTTAVTTCIELDLTHPLLSAQPVLTVVTPNTAGQQNDANRGGNQ